MTFIPLQQEVKMPLRVSMFAGASGAGKTFLSATFPKVAWIGSAREGGVETIRSMYPEDFHDPRQKPLCFAVSSIAEMHEHMSKDIWPRVLKGEIETIALELTFYADDIVRKIKAAQGKEDKPNGWIPYQTLEEHITILDEKAKSHPNLRLNYNAISVEPEDKKNPGGILVPGRALAKKLPAMTDLWGYLTAEDGERGVDRVLYTGSYGPFIARHRYRDRLPYKIRNPTFAKLLGLYRGSLIVDEEGYVKESEAVSVQVPGVGVGEVKRLKPLRQS